MSGQTGFRFLCPGCRASFGWKPQYAGRKIRCKCGQVFMPPDPAAASGAEEPDPYDVTDGPVPVPSRAAPAAPRAAPVHTPVHAQVQPAPAAPASMPAAAPSDRLAGVAAMYAPRRRRAVVQETDPVTEGSALKDLFVPIALLALGLGLRIGQLMYANGSRANKWNGHIEMASNPRRAIILALLEMIINGGAMIAGATLAAVMLNLNFGSLGKAALKLCALAAFATGMASWVALIDQDRFSVQGLAIALHLVVITYWIGFAYLFALELQETLLAVAIVSLLQAAAMCAMARAA